MKILNIFGKKTPLSLKMVLFFEVITKEVAKFLEKFRLRLAGGVDNPSTTQAAESFVKLPKTLRKTN